MLKHYGVALLFGILSLPTYARLVPQDIDKDIEVKQVSIETILSDRLEDAIGKKEADRIQEGRRFVSGKTGIHGVIFQSYQTFEWSPKAKIIPEMAASHPSRRMQWVKSEQGRNASCSVAFSNHLSGFGINFELKGDFKLARAFNSSSFSDPLGWLAVPTDFNLFNFRDEVTAMKEGFSAVVTNEKRKIEDAMRCEERSTQTLSLHRNVYQATQVLCEKQSDEKMLRTSTVANILLDPQHLTVNQIVWERYEDIISDETGTLSQTTLGSPVGKVLCNGPFLKNFAYNPYFQ